MAKPWVHAMSSARKFGGTPEDYLAIHNHIDSTKGAFADNRHRAITHNAWYIGPGGPLELALGVVMTNSEGRQVPVRSVAEQHILEDFGGFIPTLQDFLCAMDYKPWMNGQGDSPSPAPTSAKPGASPGRPNSYARSPGGGSRLMSSWRDPWWTTNGASGRRELRLRRYIRGRKTRWHPHGLRNSRA